MARKRFTLFFLLAFLSSSVLSQLDTLFFPGFKDVGNNMSVNGLTQIESNGLLRMTNETSRKAGHAFYSKPINFRNSTTAKAYSFSTAFAFAIFPEFAKLGGHGLAFAVSPSKEMKNALPSQYLGLLNASDNGNFTNHIFAVEFDTVQDFEFGDISDNHVGININSMVSNASANASYIDEGNSTKIPLRLQSGQVIQAWIDYDSVKSKINVSLSLSSRKPNISILSFDIDLSPILRDTMYVGFSASTGLLASSHYILGWSFKMNGLAQSLDLSVLPPLPEPKTNHTVLITAVLASTIAFLVLTALLSIYLVKKIKNMDVIESWELHVGPHRYSYKELKKATKGFRDRELLGIGGFGRVYKGILPKTKTPVAVKRISHESRQGIREFVSEIDSIGHLRHRNLVQLLGWCRRRADLLLVYDFMPNGSLDKYIFDKSKKVLSWDQRFKIIKGVASGLLYLHEGWEQTVIHRDIKAGNVLLDSELNGRLGDFGLAKLYEHGANPSTTRVVGTLGYLAPELTKTGKPTTGSDVFAFGALLLEVVCGRRPIEHKALPEELVLVDWVWDRWRSGAIFEVVDPRLRGEYDEIEAVVVIKLGLMCSQSYPENRPTMRQVLRYLEGEVALPEVLLPTDEYGRKKIANVAGSGSASAEFEDFVHSYPTSSYFDKPSPVSPFGIDMNLDVEACSASPLSFSGGGDGR